MTLGRRSRVQTAKIRKQVFERDLGKCIAEGVFGFCGGGLTLQHRAGRGMGGSASQDGFENLLTMCETHNELETASADFHRLCQKLGWSIPRWAHDQGFADVIPVWFPRFGWFQLDTDGAVSMISERRAKEVFAAVYGAGFIAE